MPIKSAEELVEMTNKTRKNSRNPFVRLLIFLKKIEKPHQFDKYLRENIHIPLIEWIIQVFIIRALLIFIVLSVAFGCTRRLILFAEGISLFWYLIVSLKKDLWRQK